MRFRQRMANDFSFGFKELIEKYMQDRSDVFPSCISCIHWNEQYEGCNKFQQKPPAKIIVNACPEYEDHQEIPF